MSAGVKTPADPFATLGFREKAFPLGGTDWKFRELSVQESDACIDAARKENGDIDGRTHMRLMIVKSSVEPKITLDQLAKLPNRVYLLFADFVNELNSVDDALEDKKEEGEKSEGNA